MPWRMCEVCEVSMFVYLLEITTTGHAADYDRWGKEGALGWNYASCLSYFRRAQNHNLATVNDKYRGNSGPLGVTQGAGDNPLHQAWLLAGVQAG